MQISMNTPVVAKEDSLAESFRSIAQEILAVVFGLLPILFIPVAVAPLSYTKVYVVGVAVLVSLIFYSLFVLRAGTIRFSGSPALYGLWGVVVATVLSALFSGDMYDSFIGDVVGDRTAVFMFILALSATLMVLIGQSKASVMRLYMLLTISAVVLTVYHSVRLLFGPELLTFSVFTSSVGTPVGGWNDLGLLFGLIVLLALIALEQLPLTTWGRSLFAAVVVLSLIMLAVVNFFAVWVVLALAGLVGLMYGLVKDRFSASQLLPHTATKTSYVSLALSALVSLTALVFIVGGGAVGGWVNNLTGLSYVEVRPSVEATIDIGRAVYQENMFFGTGPNRFVDAWRQYKNPAINQTVFWSTDFSSGSGYIPTLMVSTGLVGMVAWIIFLLLFLRAGYRMLFGVKTADKFWYFIASSAVVAACYLWGLSFTYVPGPTIILLAGIFTGVALVAYVAIVPVRTATFSAAIDKRATIVLVGMVMVVIVGAATALYFLSQHYLAVYSYEKAINSVGDGVSVESIEQKIAAAYAANKNDRYARQIAQYELAKLNTLLTTPTPTSEQQEQFQQAAVAAINAARLAVANDATEAYNHATLGAIYAVLAAAGFTDAAEQAKTALAAARLFDPTNPLYHLIEAQMNMRTGNHEGARDLLRTAIELKADYTDALFMLAQVDIAIGDVEEAITATRSIVTLDPANPARHYQLGVLYSSAGDRDAAIESFKRAIVLDPNYANAHYFLGLAYADLGLRDEAIAEFVIVRDLNPSNVGIAPLIDELQRGTSTISLSSAASQVTEPPAVVTDEEAIITNSTPDTPLISPVNVVPVTPDTSLEVAQ